MAVSALLSWIEVDASQPPSAAGIGVTTSGSGLVVLIAGLFLLLWPSTHGSNMGWALGGFTVAIIFIMQVVFIADPYDFFQLGEKESLGSGAWVGLGGSAVAFLGTCWGMLVKRDRMSQKIDLFPAIVGAILAITSTFLLSWALVIKIGGEFEERTTLEEVIHGVNKDVITGIPIVVLGGIAIVVILALAANLVSSSRTNQLLIGLVRMSGIAIAVLATADILFRVWGFQSITLSPAYDQFAAMWSGPLVAATGGVVLAWSVRTVETSQLPPPVEDEVG